MNKLFYILFFGFCFLGCNNNNNNNKPKSYAVEKSMPVFKKPEPNETTQSKNLFDLIQNKKETAQDLPKDFDFSRNYTDAELKTLNLDPTKIDATEYYFLSEQKFLKEEVEGLSFQIYYKHLYGYLLEKIVRVQRTDTVFDIILSAIYSNGSDGSTLSTEFRSNNLFQKSWADVKTVKDEPYLMAYYIDSVWTYYQYNDRLDLIKNTELSAKYYKEITENPETGKRDSLFQKINPLGKIKNTEFFSGVSYADYNKNLPETITIYSKNKETKTELETIETWGAYIHSMELFTLNKNHFIYIEMFETSGNSYSYFFSVDTETMTLDNVELEYANSKIPDTLQIFKGYGIMKEANNKFTSGGILRSENGGSYYFVSKHKMTEENGKFILKCIDTKINPKDE